MAGRDEPARSVATKFLKIEFLEVTKNLYLCTMLSGLVLILLSLAGTAGTIFYFRRNLIRIAEKNRTIDSKAKRVLNYPLTVLWYGYMLVFFVGLSVNNLIFA